MGSASESAQPAGRSLPSEFSVEVQRVAAPLREQVLESLRQAILDFHLKPGQRLIERELIEQIGVSRTVIREALQQLVADGLVTTTPQRGTRVVVLSAEEAAELYEVRAALEVLAVEQFIRRASEDQLHALKETVQRFREAVERNASVRELLAAKDRFYAAILDGARNREVGAILSRLQARVRLLRANSLSKPGRAHQSLEELESLIHAIERRDAETAAKICTQHLNNAAEVGFDVAVADSGDGIAPPADWDSTREA